MFKKSLVNKLNKFVFIYGATSEKKNDLKDIVNPKNRLNFLVENLLYKENLTLPITKVSGKEADIVDKEIRKFPIICYKKPQRLGKNENEKGNS